MKSNVGILGLGIIGSRVAENLRKAGHEVFVWSRSARPVPNFLSSPHEVAEAAGIIQIFVRDSAALLEAIEDMKPALKSGHLVMNHATVSKAATLEAAKLVEETGAAFLDAPFTGSKMAAQNGKLSYYIGGSDLLLERARPVLEASAAKIIPLGAVGEAMVLKIVTNLVSAVIVEAVSEAADITKANGIPLERLLTALESNANFSTLIGMKLPAIIKSEFEPHFALVNMLKDADFARELAAESKLSTPALDCTAAAMRSALEAGKGDLDFSVIGQR
ncbi:NAD(P)-dependent oxidoreductase [Prosthecobacter sp.]|uniref:NAD(P)-dependent oxidoreductase n=1 Tax=Prosthecobacter sp. TaxID=1965333 RepID=UPI0037852333